MTRTKPETWHGTDAGAQRHQRRGEKPCEACRVARNAYRAEVRALYGTKKQHRQARLRARALSRLAVLHKEDYDRLYGEEVQRDLQVSDQA